MPARRPTKKFIITIAIISQVLLWGATGYLINDLFDRTAEMRARNPWFKYNTATTIVETKDYNAFPKLLRLQDARLWLTFYRGNGHVDSNNNGTMWQAFSNDNGTTWTNATILADHPSLDTRNPAMGQLDDGTLIFMFAIYDRNTRHSHRCQWIYSTDGGTTWSQPYNITNEEFGINESAPVTWSSPYGNLFKCNGEWLSAFYGVGSYPERTSDQDCVIILSLNFSAKRWAFKSIAAESYNVGPESFTTGHNEAAVAPAGPEWICLSRTRLSSMKMYLSVSGDNCTTWTQAKDSGITGQAPDLVFLGEKNGTFEYFCAYRGENGLLRGGLARYDPVERTLTCEDAVLHAASGRGGGDFAYPSGVANTDGSAFFVHYEVLRCIFSTRGRILKQTWKP